VLLTQREAKVKYVATQQVKYDAERQEKVDFRRRRWRKSSLNLPKGKLHCAATSLLHALQAHFPCLCGVRRVNINLSFHFLYFNSFRPFCKHFLLLLRIFYQKFNKI